MNYVPLHTHDTFSILDGMYKPKDYLLKAKELGMQAYAETNHGTMAGVFEFVDAAAEVGIKPIIGVEAYLADDKTVKDKSMKYSHIILLAKNKAGYDALLEAQYVACNEGFYYRPRIDWRDLEKMQGNVIVSSACIGGIVSRFIQEKDPDQALKNAERLKSMFGEDFYLEHIALQRTEFYGPVWLALREIGQKLKIKSVITTDSHYLNKGDAEYQDLVHNVGSKFTMEDIKAGKGWIFQDRDLYLKDYNEVKEIMSRIFKESIVEKYLENTNEVASKIEVFKIFPGKDILPQTDFNEVNLKAMIKDGLAKKCPPEKIDAYKERLNFEYKVIKGMGFLEYFWIVCDVINWAKKNDIAVGCGRGSAAGSLVSYLLNITDIDPIAHDLSFERFLNPTRKKMPDIDVDFQKSRRQDVLQYIVNRYGAKNVTQIANYSHFTDKSSLKDVLRIYGIDFKQANTVTKYYDQNQSVPAEYQKYFEISKHLNGNVRQLSKNASGVIITDKEIYKYIPVNMVSNNLVSGIDKDLLGKKGFLKLDILGLMTLDVIHLTLKYIKKYEGVDVNLSNLDLKDDNVLKIYRDVDVSNLFQYDTYGFKDLLQQLEVYSFKQLVELNALNRPVPLSLGFHIQYIERSLGVEYQTPKLLKKHLDSTFGLLLYQEQVINIMSEWLEVTKGEGDILRRKLEDAKMRDLIDMNKLYKKYDKEDVDDAVKFLEQAVGYSFNLSHSVSYAYLSFQTAYLKTYYRKYFYMAVLNIEDDEDKLQTTINDCYKHGVTLKDYNINEISYNFTLDKEGNMIPGCKILKGIGDKSVGELIENKPYKDFDDFTKRAKVRSNVLKVLYDYDFFKNAFGDIENKKVKQFLINKSKNKK